MIRIGFKTALILGLAGLTAPVLLAQGNGNSAQAGQDNAFFTGPGTHGATLNGAPLLPGTAVLADETVTTQPGGVAVLAPTHGAGGVIELGGNSTATVHNGAVGAGGSATDQLAIQQGDARISGNVTVTTPQGQVFQPQSGSGASYVINAGAEHSTMGVLTGSVKTYTSTSGAKPDVILAGNAIQVNTGALEGQARIQKIKFNEVTNPGNDVLTQLPPVSQSQ